MAMNPMSASGLMSMSTVSFPASESESEATSLPAAHLPFRRISLPAKPSQSGTPFRHSQSGSPFRQSQSGAPFRQSGVNSGRRCAVVRELYATEKTYVEGLDLIYTHFLTPLVASLSTSSPLVTPAQLTSIFGNFIDVWNLHRTFFAALDAHLGTNGLGSRALSSVLLAHFPYLSLYTPFVTRFSDALGTLYAASKNGSGLAAFVARQEADPRCGKLRLGDWLLTIVQRCPRYLLLLRDLLACIPPHDPDRRGLEAAYALVEKTTTSLNTSLHAHAHTLALVALQRSTAHLPPDLDFVAPARALLRRGPLRYHGSATRDSWYGDTAPRTAEFLLFTDSLVWIEPEGHERWVYKGHIDLVDIEVVLDIHTRREAKIEIRSPGGSFAMFAPQEADRYSDDRDRDDIDDNASVHHLQTWAHALRAAKSARLALLAAAPDSTLTSSASTNHLRRALRALPPSQPLTHVPNPSHRKPHRTPREPFRAPLTHFLPPLWVPDADAPACMRCARPFGWGLGRNEVQGGQGRIWLRRRHHCRLCGRCVCAECSGKTFYISDTPNTTQNPGPAAAAASNYKPARACDECYEAAF
ncbi:Dbl homology domain-containing protein, partial [Hygrophoropsis aurantiaca]